MAAGDGASSSAGRSIESGVYRYGVAISLVALVTVVVFGAWVGDDRWEVMAVGAVLFLAAGSIGLFAGFLFGLPRSASDGTVPQGSTSRYLFNSNLVKVSDWLTTIIVGVTLVNVRSVASGVADFGEVLQAPLGDEPGSAAFGVSLVVFGFASGAILMYLWTTLRMRELLEQSEREIQSAADLAKQAIENLAGADGSLDLTRVKDVVDVVPSDAVPDVLAAVQSSTGASSLQDADRLAVVSMLQARLDDPSDPAGSS